MSSARPSPTEDDPPRSGATSIYLWGDDRPNVNYHARTLARELDPQFRWVEVSTEEYGKHVTAEGFDSFLPSEFDPEAGRQVLLWTYLIPDRRRRKFNMNRFLQLPEPIQLAIGSMLSREPPRLLAVANVDRLGAYDPAGTGFYGQFIDWLNDHEITFMVTSTGEAQLERIDFEYSVNASPPDPTGRSLSVGTCHWGECSTCIFRGLYEAGRMRCVAAEVRGRKPTESNPVVPP